MPSRTAGKTKWRAIAAMPVSTCQVNSYKNKNGHYDEFVPKQAIILEIWQPQK